jgi:poly-gamma-glutamate synthesis protein (capsule biosynthesis protein)
VEVADALVDMGVDIALLANNHCCDRMARGINTTIEELERRNIAHTGVFRVSVDYLSNNIYRFDIRGVRFALLNYTYGTNGIPVPDGKIVNLIDDETIVRDLQSINRDSVDCVIACMHWGNEYERKQNREQKRLAELLKREGADIIIGGHPHVVQPYEVDSSHVVFFSLGNLVSNQQRRYCDGGLIAEVEVIRCDTVERLRYRAKAHPVYVICPGYKITPRHIGDTLPMSEDLRRRYTQFMSDTDENLAMPTN